MEVVTLVARFLLAGVMGVAGFAKFADLGGSRQAMLDFGVPARFAPVLGFLLPLAEVAVAILLLFAPVAWWGAGLALLLLLAFIVGISVNLARGQRPNCHCFGQLHSEPIGWQTLARNGILALIAGWLLWQGPEQIATSGATLFAGTQTVTWIALIIGVVALLLAAIEGWFLLHLLQQNGRLLLRIESLEAQAGEGNPALPTNGNAKGLPVGTLAPAFSLAGLHGETLTLDSLRAAQKPLLLLFVDPACGPCNALLPEVMGWQQDFHAMLTFVAISRGKAEVNRAGENGLQTVLLQKDFEVAKSYQVTNTPSAVLVRPNGTIGSAVVAGAEAIRALVASATGAAQPTFIPLANRNGANGAAHRAANGKHAMLPISQIGEVAPAFQLPDLSDKMLDLTHFKGHPTLIAFWNPACGYCRQMLDDLRDWEVNRGEGAPNLLLISTGSAEANRAMNLQSPILRDADFSVGRTFGARGTPSAILIDEEGRIASEVVIGRDAVLVLARGEQMSIGGVR